MGVAPPWTTPPPECAVFIPLGCFGTFLEQATTETGMWGAKKLPLKSRKTVGMMNRDATDAKKDN